MITGQTTSNTYQGDGSNRVWNISFEFTDSSQIKFKVNGETVETNFALNTVAKTLTYPTVASELDPLTSADEIVIYRDTSITQNIDFTNGGPLNAEMIEDGLDKLTMISQEILRVAKNSGLEAGKGIDITDGVISVKGIKVLADETDIDTLTEEGEYFIRYASCTSGFPSDLVVTPENSYSPAPNNGVCAYVKVVPTDATQTQHPTVKVTQICVFYTCVSIPQDIASFSGLYIRTYNSSEEYGSNWASYNIMNKKRKVACGINMSNVLYFPSVLYPNTEYYLGNFIRAGSINSETIVPLTSLTLTDLPDSPYPISLIFKTGNSFSGITASQIKGWIGNTTLDTNSGYKITIENLIGTIEKITVVE